MQKRKRYRFPPTRRQTSPRSGVSPSPRPPLPAPCARLPLSIINQLMSVTERLYYADSHLIEFDAHVLDITERVSGWTAVTLDRTAFYPTGGGQPSDTGVLGGARVVECTDQGDTVLHVIQGPTPKIGE